MNITMHNDSPRADRPERACAQCGRPLAPSARSSRRYCSSPCRWQHWAKENGGPGRRRDAVPDFGQHWHIGQGARGYLLVGDPRAGFWRGPGGCPPYCAGPAPGVWAVPIAVGMEGKPPPMKRPA
jgi:hypothetical protein